MRRLALLLFVVVASCSDTGSPDEDWGMEGPVEPLPPPGKEDSEYRKGLFVNTNTSRTQVWTARNKWEDRDTSAAKAAGLAWGENSGLDWDEKYVAWIESFGYTPSVDNYSTTFMLTTPWGKTLPSPSLECAEMALFLRITFAAWYELPLQFEAISGGRRVYFGHYGVRTTSGRFANTPEFAIAYKDHTSSTTWRNTWPKDATLRTRQLWGGEDNQLELAPGAKFGAYVDEVHLNKRAAYFTVLVLNYLSSVNLADAANMYNLTPESVRTGDVLLKRWQAVGIGHTLIVKEVNPIGASNYDITLISSSMPRRQGVKESGVSSKYYFTSEYAGGPGYERLGGGIKRFRVTKNVGGYWTNTWMEADEASWINSTDYARIGERPARFQTLLGQASPQQQKAELLTQIANARHHLSQYPASCAARERREGAFSALYGLADELNTTQAALDEQYRQDADYVLAELEYTKSKTCCWNSSSAAMYDIITKKAAADKVAADAQGVCKAPIVFKSRTDGYKYWADYAASIGRGSEWKAWTEDESCPQKNVVQDTESALSATPYCSL